MLKFYYHPLSPLARRVWIALLEKQLDFEPVVVNLSAGEQLKPEFLAISPFHHVPAIVDNGVRVIESLAILDYLESKYPQISLLPTQPETLARVRMAQIVTNSELGSQVVPLVVSEVNSSQKRLAAKHLKRVCKFLSELLDSNTFFGGEQFTVGDVVAGNGLILIDKLAFSLERYPNLAQYCDRLMARQPWQQAQPKDDDLQVWVEVVKKLYKTKSDRILS